MSIVSLCVLLLTAVQADPPPAQGGVESAIAAALQNHPDVRVAEANRQLAEAELEQTKLAVSRRVSAAAVKLEVVREKYAIRERALQLIEKSGGTKQEAVKYQIEMMEARTELLTADEELKAAVGADKVPSSAAAGVASALKSHPDVKVAEAKRAVAVAMAEQAKLAVSQKVPAVFAKLQAARVKVQGAEDNLRRMAAQGKGGSLVSEQEVERANHEVQLAKAELAAAEAELKAVTGGGTRAESDPAAATTTVRLKTFMRAMSDARAAPAGSAVDTLRAALDKPVKLDLKETDLPAALGQVLKAAGADGLTVRGLTNFGPQLLKAPPRVQAFSGEQTVVAWLQMLLDDFNRDPRNLPPELSGRYDLYVREYGLVLSKVDLAAKDAVSLTEFAKLVRAENQAEKEKAKQPLLPSK